VGSTRRGLQETPFTTAIEMLDAAPCAAIVAVFATAASTSSRIASSARSTSPIECAPRAGGIASSDFFSSRNAADTTAATREIHASRQLEQREMRRQYASHRRFARYCIHTRGVMPSTSRRTPHHGAPRLVDGHAAAR
jgi:hypothetical protein